MPQVKGEFPLVCVFPYSLLNNKTLLANRGPAFTRPPRSIIWCNAKPVRARFKLHIQTPTPPGAHPHVPSPSTTFLLRFRMSTRTTTAKLRAMVFQGVALNLSHRFTFFRAGSFLNKTFCPATAWPTSIQIIVDQCVKFSVCCKFDTKKVFKSCIDSTDAVPPPPSSLHEPSP